MSGSVALVNAEATAEEARVGEADLDEIHRSPFQRASAARTLAATVSVSMMASAPELPGFRRPRMAS